MTTTGYRLAIRDAGELSHHDQADYPAAYAAWVLLHDHGRDMVTAWLERRTDETPWTPLEEPYPLPADSTETGDMPTNRDLGQLTAGMTTRGRTVIHAAPTANNAPPTAKRTALCDPFGEPLTRPQPDAVPTCSQCLALLAGSYQADYVIPSAWQQAVDDAARYL
jgi:hypothetical protein